MFKIPEQKRAHPFLGGLKELFSRVMFYAGIINFVLISVTAYNTSIKYVMPIPYLAFFSILMVGLSIAMIFEYIIVLPSSVAFSNRQSYKHDNPIRDDMLKILKKLDDVSKRLESMENEIKILKENGGK